VKVEPVHDGAPHCTVELTCVHAPEPLHVPVLPQVPLLAHPPRGSPAPAATLVQVPRLPATLQAWQVEHVGLPQQTPSTQLPLVHWLALEQAAPAPSRGWQVPPVPVQ